MSRRNAIMTPGRCHTSPPVAIKAMAAKLARLVYRMLRYGMKYLDQGAGFYETQHRKQRVIHLKRKAAQLGLQIIEVAAAA
jgi:transposase